MIDLKTNLSLPVIAAPMFLVSGVDLVVEACKNGIIGTFPSLNGRSSEDFENMLIQITEELATFEKNHNRKAAPFGVNLIVHKTNKRIEKDLALCVKYKVPLVITSLGAVKDIVQTVHDYGGKVFHDIVKKRHAEKAAEAGVDGLILVCAGAGGHAGTANPFALMTEIKSFYTGQIILAGGIHNGKQIKAAEILGADYAYIGTHFIASKESMASLEYKEMLINSEIKDITYTKDVSGIPGNFIKQSIERAQKIENEDIDFINKSENSKAWKDIWSAGQGVTAIKKIKPLKDIIQELKTEYNAC